jgi:hypothetical protein
LHRQNLDAALSYRLQREIVCLHAQLSFRLKLGGRPLPIMWSHGTGAEVMQRIAVPMIGGMISSTLLTLIVIPAIYAVVKNAALRVPRAEASSATDLEVTRGAGVGQPPGGACDSSSTGAACAGAI